MMVKKMRRNCGSFRNLAHRASSITVGQEDSILLVYVNRLNQLYDSLSHTARHAGDDSLSLDYIDLSINNSCIFMFSRFQCILSIVPFNFTMHYLKFPLHHHCSLRSLHNETTRCCLITLIVPSQERALHCLTTLIVLVILMMHIFMSRPCPPS